jgi:urocanate hydratase
MLLDGSVEADNRLRKMLHFDVNNGIARRAWARNEGALAAIARAQQQQPLLKVTVPFMADDALIGKTTQP